jgi:SAM-dependent methyltransferase
MATTLANRILKRLLKVKLKRAKRNDAVPFCRIAPGTSEYFNVTGTPLRVLNVVRYTTTNDNAYNAVSFKGGYHSFTIPPYTFPGQRDPGKRFQVIPFDFTDKCILDLGCNQGGMLFHISDRIRWGVGTDFDPKMINAANRIKSARQVTNCDFYTFDFDREPLDLLFDYLRDDEADMVFLFAVCKWLRKWKELIAHIRRIAPVLLFESNGSVSQQNEQLAFLRATFDSVELLADRLPDDPQHPRKLFLASVR